MNAMCKELKTIETEEGQQDVVLEPSTSMFSFPYTGKSPYVEHKDILNPLDEQKKGFKFSLMDRIKKKV